MSPLVATLVIIAAVVVIGAVLFRLTWRVAEPNKALLISGSRRGADSLGFRTVTGGGTLVIPGVQRVRVLDLDLKETDLEVDCRTHQGIPVRVKGVVIFKIGDDDISIANAARRFLDQQREMEPRVHHVFAGHLRSIVGSLTLEQMLRDRESLSDATRKASSAEMEKLGLVIDSMQIHSIADSAGYLDALAKPQVADIQKIARIAQAQADREATEAEAESQARQAEARRTAAIDEAGYQAQVDQATAQAAQAGPLADARARQAVTREETKAAELAAELADRELDASVRRPADAGAYEAEVLARASAEATRVQGHADADVARAAGLSAAAVIRARAAALASNPEAVVAQQIADAYPEIVRAAGEALGAVGNVVVLDGGQGLEALLGRVITMGGAGLGVARSLLDGAKVETPAIPALGDGGLGSWTGALIGTGAVGPRGLTPKYREPRRGRGGASRLSWWS